MWNPDFEMARKLEEQSIVLLRNEKNMLPLDAREGAEHRDHRTECRHGDDLGRRFGAGGSSGKLARRSG